MKMDCKTNVKSDILLPLSSRVARILESNYNKTFKLVEDNSEDYFRPFCDELQKESIDLITKWPNLFKYLTSTNWKILEVHKASNVPSVCHLVAICPQNFDNCIKPYKFCVWRRFGAGAYGEVSAIHPLSENNRGTFALKIVNLLAKEDTDEDWTRLTSNIIQRETCQELMSAFYDDMKRFWYEAFEMRRISKRGLRFNSIVYLALMRKENLKDLVNDALIDIPEEYSVNRGQELQILKEVLCKTDWFLCEMVRDYKHFRKCIERIVDEHLRQLDELLPKNRELNIIEAICNFLDDNVDWSCEDVMNMIPVEIIGRHKLLNLPHASWINISVDEVKLYVLGRPFHETYRQYIDRLYQKCKGSETAILRDIKFRTSISTIMMTLAYTLSEVHDVGCVHRDLTPENILGIMHSGEQKSWFITDFSLTRRLPNAIKDESQKDESDLDRLYLTPGKKIGKTYYRAPELLNPNVLYNEKIDVFSLGIIFYESLAKQMFKNEYLWETAVYATIRTSKVNPKISKYFKQEAALIDSMINSNCNQRPSALECYKKLHEIVTCLYPCHVSPCRNSQDKDVSDKSIQFEQFLQQIPDQSLRQYLETTHPFRRRSISECQHKEYASKMKTCGLHLSNEYATDGSKIQQQQSKIKYGSKSLSLCNLVTVCKSDEVNDEEFGSYEEAQFNALFARYTILLPSQEAMLALPTSSFEKKPPTNTIDLCTPARIYSG